MQILWSWFPRVCAHLLLQVKSTLIFSKAYITKTEYAEGSPKDRTGTLCALLN